MAQLVMLDADRTGGSSLAPNRGKPAEGMSDPELRMVLELATDEELMEVEEIRYGTSGPTGPMIQGRWERDADRDNLNMEKDGKGMLTASVRWRDVLCAMEKAFTHGSRRSRRPSRTCDGEMSCVRGEAPRTHGSRRPSRTAAAALHEDEAAQHRPSHARTRVGAQTNSHAAARPRRVSENR